MNVVLGKERTRRVAGHYYRLGVRSLPHRQFIGHQRSTPIFRRCEISARNLQERCKKRQLDHSIITERWGMPHVEAAVFSGRHVCAGVEV